MKSSLAGCRLSEKVAILLVSLEQREAVRKSTSASLPRGMPEARNRQQKGGIAQLGERLHGMQEVSGSIPLTSTNKPEQTAQFERRRRIEVPFV